MSHRAVIFDLGGVVLGSPMHAIADYEREHEVAAGAVNRLIVANGPYGTWARLERGELRQTPSNRRPSVSGSSLRSGITRRSGSR